mgnify:CR=1 FL=1
MICWQLPHRRQASFSHGRTWKERIRHRSLSASSTVFAVLRSFVRPCRVLGGVFFRPRGRARRTADSATSAVSSAAATLSASAASASGSTSASAASERTPFAFSASTASRTRRRVSRRDRNGFDTTCDLSADERIRGRHAPAASTDELVTIGRFLSTRMTWASSVNNHHCRIVAERCARRV